MLSSFSHFVEQISSELTVLLPSDIVVYVGCIVVVMLILAAWRLVS